MNSDSDSRCETRVLPARLATGQSLKHFRLESLLGEGGMGVVYRAQDTQLCRPVAVKVLPAELTADSDRKQRFLQEARAAARINHPAVAQIYAVDEQDGVTFIVMELVEGKTVRDLIQSGALDLLGAVDIVVQAADGLAKAHDLGIVHRDIKPANLMVTPEGHVKILDFGLAKLLDRTTGLAPQAGSTVNASNRNHSTVPGLLMGTAAYMSPEQAKGAAVDCRADIFSLGVLLFEMVTGQSPFQRGSFMESLHAVAYEEAPPLSSSRVDLPAELQQIVTRCLRKQPEDRYPNARLFARDLKELRRRTETGLVSKASWRARLMDSWDQLRQVKPSHYVIWSFGLLLATYALYLSYSRIGTGGITSLAVLAFIVARHLRNRSQRVEESLVARLAKIPEVRLVTGHQRQFTVVVERPVAQLYSRINRHVAACNRKLYFGQPMSISILNDLTPAKAQELLSGPGVRYVRQDLINQARTVGEPSPTSPNFPGRP